LYQVKLFSIILCIGISIIYAAIMDKRNSKPDKKNVKLYTIGVYGSTPDSFFRKLTDNNIDTFCDIRRRRGVRGAEYAFANSTRLQNRLKKLDINYLHILGLSPPDEIRQIQYSQDKEQNTSQRKRETLSKDFIKAYNDKVLQNFDFKSLIDQLNALNSKMVVLFCVEKSPAACHRSLAAEYLNKKYNFPVYHL
jgi:uncharacterized protein (DUF488 family)